MPPVYLGGPCRLIKKTAVVVLLSAIGCVNSVLPDTCSLVTTTTSSESVILWETCDPGLIFLDPG